MEVRPLEVEVRLLEVEASQLEAVLETWFRVVGPIPYVMLSQPGLRLSHQTRLIQILFQFAIEILQFYLIWPLLILSRPKIH